MKTISQQRLGFRFAVFTTAALIAASVLSVSARADDETEASKAWVMALDNSCVYDDGYVCKRTLEDDFLSPAADSAMIPGLWMIAWSAALSDFNANDELTSDARDLKHYKIGFSQNDEHYIVLFRALLLPQLKNGEIVGILRTSIGQTTKYWIDRNTFQVAQRQYLR